MSVESELKKLADQGWSLDSEAVQRILQQREDQKEPLLQTLLNTDLSQIGVRVLPEDINRTPAMKLTGPHILQIISVTDTALPTRLQDTKSDIGSIKGRLLRLGLTDGKQKCVGVEYTPLEGLKKENIIPGTKVKIQGCSVKLGVLLLGSKCLAVLGGRVEELAENYEVQQRYGGPAERGGSGAGGTAPPKFLHFDPKKLQDGGKPTTSNQPSVVLSSGSENPRQGGKKGKGGKDINTTAVGPPPPPPPPGLSSNVPSFPPSANSMSGHPAGRGHQGGDRGGRGGIKGARGRGGRGGGRQGAFATSSSFNEASGASASHSQYNNEYSNETSSGPGPQPVGVGAASASASASSVQPNNQSNEGFSESKSSSVQPVGSVSTAPGGDLAKAKLLERLQAKEQEDTGRYGRGRGPRGRGRRGRFDDDDDGTSMTLEEYEAKQKTKITLFPTSTGASYTTTSTPAQSVQSQSMPSSTVMSDEELARKLQRELDLEDAYARPSHSHIRTTGNTTTSTTTASGGHGGVDLQSSLLGMFSYDGNAGAHAGGVRRGRGRGRGRGRR